MKDEKRWEKAAARENARRDARAPLFAHAGLVEHTTTAKQKERVERIISMQAEKFAAHDERSRRKIDLMRADLRALVGDGGMAAIDAKRRIYPKGLAYDLDLLTGELVKATGKTPLEVFEAYRERPRVEQGRLRVDDQAEEEREHAAELEAEASEEAAKSRRAR